jgi:hypothetical protein
VPALMANGTRHVSTAKLAHIATYTNDGERQVGLVQARPFRCGHGNANIHTVARGTAASRS